MFEIKVTGKYALFADPLTKIGGEKYSSSIPSYSALIGLLEQIYWRPTFYYVIDEVRVMNRIARAAIGTRPISLFESKPIMSLYTYLTDVEYRIRAHYEWDLDQTEMVQDRDPDKHTAILNRMIEKGGRGKPCLGTTECVAYVEKADFNEGKGYYDNSGIIDFGPMLHGITYATKNDPNGYIRFWNAEMENGIIRYPRPENCPIVKNAGILNKWKLFPNKKGGCNELEQ